MNARKIAAIAQVTLSEILRDKILYNILLCAVLLLGVGGLAARLSFIQPVRVLLDFGISAVSLMSAAVGVLIGAGMLAREYDRRTLWVALSRPISFTQFIVGKYLGLCAVLALNWLLLSASFAGVLALLSDSWRDWFSWTWVAGMWLSLAQACFLAAIAVFFSAFSSVSLAVTLTVGVYLVGTNVSQIRLLASKIAQSGEPALAWLLKGVAALWPNLENFQLGTNFTYQLPVSAGFFWGSMLYAVVGIAVYMTLASVFVRHRDQ